MTKTKVKVMKGKRQPDCKTLHPYRMGKDKRILIDVASRQTIEQLFSLRNAGARISDLLEVARVPSPCQWQPVHRRTDEYLSWGTHPRRLPPEAGGGEVRYDPPELP